jgi:hypothetical protein
VLQLLVSWHKLFVCVEGIFIRFRFDNGIEKLQFYSQGVRVIRITSSVGEVGGGLTHQMQTMLVVLNS